MSNASLSYAPLIKEIGRGPKGSRPLTTDQAESLFADMMDGAVPDLELGAIILSMRIKAESLDELIGFQRALDARTAHVSVPPGPRLVVLPTYNGARRQANLMPLLALLLAREGVPVLIQGRHDFASSAERGTVSLAGFSRPVCGIPSPPSLTMTLVHDARSCSAARH